jgi:hypothetical protein
VLVPPTSFALFGFFVVVFCFGVLGIELRALCLLGRQVFYPLSYFPSALFRLRYFSGRVLMLLPWTSPGP